MRSLSRGNANGRGFPPAVAVDPLMEIDHRITHAVLNGLHFSRTPHG
jgi:hypothetical protein